MSNSHLGIYTKFASEGKNETLPPVVLRLALQSVARELLPDERVATCLRFHAPDKHVVRVHKSELAKKAYYSGLMVCGSVWHCPVCAARISEVRRRELTEVVNAWTGGIAMITYTASHKANTPLTEILEAIAGGVRSFKSGRFFEEIKNRYGWIGSVKALEVTHGENGFHPHCHELVFFTNELSEELFDQLHLGLRIHWREVLGRKGWLASTENGLVMKTANSDIKDYITKWGHEPSIENPYFARKWSLEAEITKAVVKKGKREGRTMTQLLIDYMNDDFQAGELWKIYAHALKKSHQLQWSRGMRNKLKLGAWETDEVIAESIPLDTVVYASFDREAWRKILFFKLRGEILYNAGWMDEAQFSRWIAEVVGVRSKAEEVLQRVQLDTV